MGERQTSVFIPLYQESYSFPRSSIQQAFVYITKSELGHQAILTCKKDWSVPALFVSEVETGHGERVGNA